MNALVVYFSRSGENYYEGKIKELEEGNNRILAAKIVRYTGADLFELVMLNPYSKKYKICANETKKDKEENNRPELKKWIDSIDKYEIIYLVYPNYWGTMPMCMFTFLERFDFTGKIIVPFCTHEGSGFGNSIENIRATCKGAEIRKGLEIKGSNVKTADELIRHTVIN